MEKEESFKEKAEEKRESLRKRGSSGSSSDLYVNEKAGVAVIGIQTSEGGRGHDSIYVLKKGDKEAKEVLDEYSRSGRMFPTKLSENGKEFEYSIKDESGNFHRYKYDIKTGTKKSTD
jgi:hypothetical protein